jgi:hypothetical protein
MVNGPPFEHASARLRALGAGLVPALARRTDWNAVVDIARQVVIQVLRDTEGDHPALSVEWKLVMATGHPGDGAAPPIGKVCRPTPAGQTVSAFHTLPYPTYRAAHSATVWRSIPALTAIDSLAWSEA